MAAATFIFVGIVGYPRFAVFFSNALSRWLGKISFPLYLVHAPVIYSVSLGLAMLLDRQGVDAAAARLAAAFVTLPISIVAAMLLTPVNDFAVKFSHWVGVLVGSRVAAVRIAPR
jgi:peptidoglycan/LPS O-acetylase OafA/YrhL